MGVFPFIRKRVSNKAIALDRRFMGDRTASELYRIRTLSYGEYRNLCKEVVGGERSYVISHETGGLGGEQSPETVISVAEWHQDFH